MNMSLNPSPDGDHADLDIDKLGQSRDGHSFPGREFIGKIFSVDLIHIAKSVHVGDEDGGLYHVVESETGFLQNVLEVLHYLVGLFLYIPVLELAGAGIQADLPGNI